MIGWDTYVFGRVSNIIGCTIRIESSLESSPISVFIELEETTSINTLIEGLGRTSIVVWVISEQRLTSGIQWISVFFRPDWTFSLVIIHFDIFRGLALPLFLNALIIWIETALITISTGEESATTTATGQRSVGDPTKLFVPFDKII